MKSKKHIAIFLTGLFLLNFFVLHSGSFLALVSGENITVVNPFCKKTIAFNTKDNNDSVDFPVDQAREIPAVCTTFYSINQTQFRVIATEKNYRSYFFSDLPQPQLFSERFYIPPRV